ncbi:MAG TPA: hypothetical protein VKI99_10265, partial [Candidatus Dormibacteraeota bacterium]|nr:hypothetical protein [Candidatus Dormibacteraeota bacterium]
VRASPRALGDEQIEDRPSTNSGSWSRRQSADHLRPPLHLLKRALEQVRRAQPPAEAERVLQVHAERRQVLGQAGGRARV